MTLEKLVVMVKAPRPGLVKTRLAREFGPESACRAYRELVESLLANLQDLKNVELRFAPQDAALEIQPWLAPGWTSAPQGEGNLGLRLWHAVRQSLTGSPTRLVIIGSDCPWVTARDIRAAWRALEDHDVVLGPARDGGYWLIGMSQPHAVLFEDISWSTDSVLQQTVERANQRGLTTHRLRTLVDVDEVVDWEAFQRAKTRAVNSPNPRR